MKIVVCIKQVPNTNEIRIDPIKGTLIRDGVDSIMNPDDKAGLETALQLKDENPNTSITVLTMGPNQAKAILREAIAMGADDAILLTDRTFAGADTWATSLTLANAIRKIGFDVIICGRQAIDGDTAQVGPQIAEHLKIPHVSYVSSVKVQDKFLIVKREFEDFYQRIKVATPCLITALSSMNKPRYMRVGRIFDAYRNLEIKEMGQVDINVDPEELGLKGSPTKVRKTETKQAKKAGQIVELDPKESAEKIISLLAEKYII
jgi:electron transfer flavoprotein beta subunit